MNVISYRGPATAGGVSSALGRILQTCSVGAQQWWYLAQATLESRTNIFATPREIAQLSREVVAGHHRYCKCFLWPVLHGFATLASVNVTAHEQYQRFNRAIATSVMQSRELQSCQFFVNDYQLALTPALLTKTLVCNVILFWHVPWPCSVPSQYIPYLAEIAQGLLGARRIGFHTDEYCYNFMQFVADNIPGSRVDLHKRLIVHCHNVAMTTELVVLPLGVDPNFLQELSLQPSSYRNVGNLGEIIPGCIVSSLDGPTVSNL